MMKKRLLAVFLTCALVLGLLPTAALAAGETGDFTVTGGALGTDYKYESKILTVLKNTPLTISGTTTTDKIVIADGVTASITLNGLDIRFSSGTYPGECAFEVAGRATCNLTLIGNNFLKSGKARAGLMVIEGASLVITENSTGSLTAIGDQYGAGIGGGQHDRGNSCGNIIIHGGTVNATGGDNGAGIGGGNQGTGGAITITGGVVNATGGNNGAGIGGGGAAAGGNGGAGGTITINGGRVTATGSSGGAGIGGGRGAGGTTFSTGENGSAFIIASSIGDTTSQGSWSGVIFDGNNGYVGGTQTIPSDLDTIKTGQTLTVLDKGTLTIPNGKTFTNNGTITINGTLTNNGTLVGNGTYTGDGEITGDKAIPSITIPTGLTATYGQTLNDVPLTSGWAWNNPSTPVGNVGTNTFSAIFTPENTNFYKTVTQSLTVAVNKATPNFTVPTGLTATYGQTLADISLDNGWAWNDLTASVGNDGDKTFSATFTPTDTNNYQTVTQSLTVTVNKATPSVTAPKAQSLTYTGAAQNLITAGSTTGGTLQYSLSQDSGYSTAIPTGTNGGNYTVYYRVVGDNNYNDVAAGTGIPVSIAKATAPNGLPKPLNISNHLAKTYEFAFSNLRPAIAGDWGKVTYEFSGSNISFSQTGYYGGGAAISNGPSGVPNILTLPILFNDTDFAGQVGTITVTIHSQNYEDYTGTINIIASNKTAVTFSGVEGVTVPYTGQPVKGYTGTLVIEDVNGNPVTLTPEISYTGRLETSYKGTEDQPPAKAGTYFVVFRAADTDEKYIGRQPIAFEITRAAPTGEPKYTAITTGGKTLADAALTTEGGSFSVPGTVAWALDETTQVEANTAYQWVFTPTDTDNYTTLEGSVTLWQRSAGGSSSGGSATPPTTTYPPTVEKPSEGGDVPVTFPSNPKQGDTVTVTPKPDEGYQVDKITVTDRNGNTVELKKDANGSYTFTQPNSEVTIEVTYVPLAGLPWVNPFTDISESDWFYEAVKFVQERGLMNGFEDGRFGPNDTLSRAQLAQILFNKEGGPVVNYLMQFDDVAGDAWYTEAIRWATSQGIVGGYGDGRFGPNDPITREQLAVMLWRYSGSPNATDKELNFNDADEISSFALEAMGWAVENGILNGYGDGQLVPQGQATRAQVAQMLKNFVENQESENT